MVWVIERLRDSVDQFRDAPVCVWNTIEISRKPSDADDVNGSQTITKANSSSLFIVQQRYALDAGGTISHQRSSSLSSLTTSCKYCHDLGGLEGGECLLCVEKAFRICTTTMMILVVAKADTMEEIIADYEYLESNVAPMLETMSQEQTKILQQKESEVTPKKSGLASKLNLFAPDKPHKVNTKKIKEGVNKEILHFLILKMSALIKQGKYLCTSETLSETYFRNAFRNFSITEPIEYGENCTFWRHRFFVGSLYLTKSFVCFSSYDKDRLLCFPHSLIVDIKRREYYPFTKCIVMSIKQTGDYVFSEFENTNETYSIMRGIWNKEVQNNIKRQHEAIEKATEVAKSFYNDSLSSPKRFHSLNNQKLQYTRKRAGDSVMIGAGSEAEQLAKVTKKLSDPLVFSSAVTASPDHSEFDDNDLPPLFANPALEVVQQETCIFYRSFKKNAKKEEGQLQVSFRSIYFLSHTRDYAVTLPYRDLRSVTLLKTSQFPNPTLKISLKTKRGRSIYIEFDNREAIDIILQLYKSHEPTIQQCVDTLGWTERETREWKEKQRFFQSCKVTDSNEKFREASWDNYFNYFGTCGVLIRTHHLSNLVIDGIPNKYRPMMWQILSGSYYHRINEPYGYEHYLSKATACANKHDGDDPIVKEFRLYFSEIFRDLHRSLPEHPFYKRGGPGIPMLNNVLMAFAWRNPTIGYCQGMNIICALLLLFLPEEDAFFQLCAICEDILPDYFSKSMIGSLVDLQVIDALVQQYLPHIQKHLAKYAGGVAVVSVTWFMTLYVHCLPWAASLRAFDLILSEGSRAQFILALAVFKAFEKEIMQCEGEALLEKLKNQLPEQLNTNDLFKMYKHYDKLVTIEQIMSLRAEYFPQIVSDLEDFSSVSDDDSALTDYDSVSDSDASISGRSEDGYTMHNTLVGGESKPSKAPSADPLVMSSTSLNTFANQDSPVDIEPKVRTSNNSSRDSEAEYEVSHGTPSNSYLDRLKESELFVFSDSEAELTAQLRGKQYEDRADSYSIHSPPTTPKKKLRSNSDTDRTLNALQTNPVHDNKSNVIASLSASDASIDTSNDNENSSNASLASRSDQFPLVRTKSTLTARGRDRLRRSKNVLNEQLNMKHIREQLSSGCLTEVVQLRASRAGRSNSNAQASNLPARLSLQRQASSSIAMQQFMSVRLSQSPVHAASIVVASDNSGASDSADIKSMARRAMSKATSLSTSGNNIANSGHNKVPSLDLNSTQELDLTSLPSHAAIRMNINPRSPRRRAKLLADYKISELHDHIAMADPSFSPRLSESPLREETVIQKELSEVMVSSNSESDDVDVLHYDIQDLDMSVLSDYA